MGKESIIDSLEYDINIRNILCGGGRQLSASVLCRFCIHDAASSYWSELGFVRPISPIIQKCSGEPKISKYLVRRTNST